MDSEEVKATLQKDQEEWDALVQMLDSYPVQILHAPDSPPWTARDVYAHLARWIDRSIDELDEHFKGGRLPLIPGTDDEINARWAAEDSRLSFQEARRSGHNAFKRRSRAIHAVSVRQWDKRAWALANADGWKHYQAHRKAMALK